MNIMFTYQTENVYLDENSRKFHDFDVGNHSVFFNIVFASAHSIF